MSELISGKSLHGHLDTMVLAVLDKADGHGFDVWRRLESEGQGGLKLKEGSLYPALYRLEKAGLVSARWEDNETKRRGPRRRIYKITRKGKRQLEKGREEWEHFVNVVGRVVGAPA
ncbi:MAG: helix-turn-helix transcriptional regulator [Planctomycetes bacterium]|nr:helix-turn-helix transcriptional regulator [Planctomycetota bacterium]